MAAAAVASIAVVGLIATGWVARYAVAVHRLTRGVGDTVFYSADGRPWFRMDEQRNDVLLHDIAPTLQLAVIAVEDHRFLLHRGIDPIAAGRAAWKDLRHWNKAEGGSTLTQQLARTLFLSNTKTYGRKAKEAAIALLLEGRLSKREILELYLNRIYVSAGVYGVQPMSQKLFGKPARDLTLAESALIAGLIRAPGALSPWSNLDGAIRRSHTVLARMREEQFITPEAEAAARKASLKIRPYASSLDSRGGYAKDYLRQAFREEFGGDHPPGWAVHTTFVAELQQAADQAVASGLARIGGRDLQAALVAIEPATGNVVAMVGGRNFRMSPYNRATRSERQPGSAFKPLLFAAALEHGMSPASVVSNLMALEPSGPEEWMPRNAHGERQDAMTLRAALLESNNRAAVALQQRVGTKRVLQLARNLGLPEQPNVPSLALGTGLATPLQLTLAYAAFSNGGVSVRPRSLIRVDNELGQEMFASAPRVSRVLPATVAFQMTSMLQDVVERGTGVGARNLGVRFPVGGKTGTTDDFHDAWFVGFSSSLVVGVWVGYDRPRSIGREAYGARVALPIWSEFMRRAAARYVPRAFAPPAGIRGEELCAISYERPVNGCPKYTEYFKDGDETPGRLCTLHKASVGQQIRRTTEGIFSGLGKKLKKIFGR
jgi:1A family penicillin-binding protein